MKSSFLIYLDYKEQFELLSDAELGQLLRAIMLYEETREITELSGMLKMAFSFIKTQLDKDRQKYEEMCEKNRENAKKGGRPRKQMVNEKPNGFEENQTEAKKADNDNEDDNDKNKNNKKKYIKKFVPPTLEEIENYVKEKKLSVSAQYFYDYFTEGNWIDAEGKAVKSWKQKILTWNGYQKKPKQEKKSNFTGREYEAGELSSLYANL